MNGSESKPKYREIALESYIKNHTLQSMCGVMHELCNKTEDYGEYIHNIKYYLVVGSDISLLDRMPEFIWDTYKGTNWEDVYENIGLGSNKYKGWIRNQKIKIVLDEE